MNNVATAPRPAAAVTSNAGTKRVLFVNSGMLGHRAVAGLMKQAVALIPDVEAQHIDLSRDLTIADRVVRRLFSVRLTPRAGAAANLDLRRWREEVNLGLLATRRIAAAERHAPFDLLHFHTQAAAYTSLARMKRTPAIVSIDITQDLARDEAISRAARLSYMPNIVHDRYVFRAAAAIVATSEWAARSLAAAYPESAAKVRVMPYPVALDAFDRRWIDERGQRGPTARPRLLFMGGDFPRKGGPELLDAWHGSGLASRADLEIVTDWPLDAAQVPPGVTLVTGVAPYTARWFGLWRRADIFVMPTRHEAFGMVYQEAAGSGIPAVATNINAIPELVVDGVTGLLVPPGDRDALARAMGVLVDSPDLRRRLGVAARERIEERGAPAAYAAGLERIMGSVLNHHA